MKQTESPPQPRYPYKERKHIRISVDWVDCPLEEVVEQLTILTGADIKVRLDIDKSREEMLVQFNADGYSLCDLLNVILNFKCLAIDDDTGEIFENKND